MVRAARTPESPRPPPRLRRAYFDCRYGQLHLHNAIPSGGGFDELTSVLCIHDSRETGAAFSPVMAALGFERSVYAPDLPGNGQSDPPEKQSTETSVNALGDFLDSMRIRSVDLVARGDGAQVAMQLAKQRGAGVRKVVVLDAADRLGAGHDAAPVVHKLLAALGGTQPT